MPQKRLFVFTAGNTEARSHLDVSVRHPIELDRVLPNFSGADQARVRDIAAEHGLYAWGAIPGVQNTPRWKRCSRATGFCASSTGAIDTLRKSSPSSTTRVLRRRPGVVIQQARPGR